jgi:sulfite exporter TauE/SafE
MCGGIAAITGKKRLIGYQLGRGSAYALIGGVSGGVGEGVFRIFSDRPELQLVLFLSFIGFILYQAVLTWRGTLDSSGLGHIQSLFHRGWLRLAPRNAQKEPSGWFYGVASVLIPCGWILSFAVMAAATGSIASGSILMLMLWLGSMPALFAAAYTWDFIGVRFRGGAARRVMAVAIFAMSFFSITNRISSFEHAVARDPITQEITCGPNSLFRSRIVK